VRWPWERRRAAAAAAQDALRELRKARRQRAAAAELATKARVMRERNGFADAIRLAMGVTDDRG